MKEDYDVKINRLDLKLADLNEDKIDFGDLLKVGIKNLLKLDRCWNIEELNKSRDLIGSIFPENFTILENEFRTTRINEVVKIIYTINKGLDPNKNGTKKNIPSLSHQVTTVGAIRMCFVD